MNLEELNSILTSIELKLANRQLDRVYESADVSAVDGMYKKAEKGLRGIERSGLRNAEKVGSNVSNMLSYVADDLGGLGMKDLQRDMNGIVKLVRSAISHHQIGKTEHWSDVRKRLSDNYKKFTSKSK